MDEPFELSFTENFPYHSIGFRADSCAYVFSRLPKNKQRQVILIILVYSLSTIFLSSANQMLYMRYFSYIEISLSKHQSVSEWVCLSVCLFGCSLTHPKRQTPVSWNFEGWFTLEWRRFQAKKYADSTNR